MKTNIRLNIKKVILTVIVLLIAVLVVCGVCVTNKFNAWADGEIFNDNPAPFSTVAKDTETVKRAVYSTKKALPNNGTSSLSKYLNDYKNRFSHFEYVVGLPSECPDSSAGYKGLGFIHDYFSDEDGNQYYSLCFRNCDYIGFDGSYYDGSFHGLRYGMYMTEEEKIFNDFCIVGGRRIIFNVDRREPILFLLFGLVVGRYE